MPEETKILRPTARVTSPLGEGSPNYVSVSASTNTDVRVAFSFYSGDEAADKASKVITSDLAAVMGRAQQIGFSPRTSPDVTVALEDGQGGSLNLSCFLSGPAIDIQRQGGFKPSISAVGSSALMEHLKLDIYSSRFNGEGGVDGLLSEGTRTVSEVVQDGNLATRMRTLTQKLISHWENNRQASGDPEISRILQDQKHAANQNGPLDSWYRMLDNSTGSLSFDWLDLMKDNEAFNSTFNQDLLTLLRGQSIGFSSVLAGLMASFQLMTIPARDGGPGSFARLSDVWDGEVEELEASPMSQIMQSQGNSGLLPIGQVLLRGAPTTAAFIEGYGSASILGGQVLGGFPEDDPGPSADTLIIGAPYYLEKLLPWFVSSPPEGRSPGDYENFKKGYQRLTKLGVNFEEKVIKNLIRDYCRGVYIDQSLALTSFSMQTPADLSLWPGRRYRLLSGGEPILEGFLQNVEHTFARGQGGGQATSTLNFSHIAFTGFTLPNS